MPTHQLKFKKSEIRGLKHILTLLGIMITTFGFGQDLPKKLLDQAKRNMDTSQHVSEYYQGEIIMYGYSPGISFDGGKYLNNIAFKKTDGKILRLWIKPEYGQELFSDFGLNSKVQVKVTGDPYLLREVIFKDFNLKRMEAEMNAKFDGLGFLKEIKNETKTLSLKGKTLKKPENLYVNDYTTVLEARVKDVIRLKGKLRSLILDNGDTLTVENAKWNRKYLEKESLSYLRPNLPKLSGYKYESTNSFKIARYLSIMTTRGKSQSVQILGSITTFIDKIDGFFDSISPNSQGLLNEIIIISDSGKRSFLFSTKDAKLVNQFILKNKNDTLSLFYKQKINNNIDRARYEYRLHALATQNDTIFTSNYEMNDFTIDNFSSTVTKGQGVISDIVYSSFIKNGSTDLENTKYHIGIIIDNATYIRIRKPLALSIANYIDIGKKISFEGWQRKEIEGEINEKGFSIIIPSKITLNNKVFNNNITLKPEK